MAERQKGRVTHETLRLIYDTSSGGLGAHVYAVRNLAEGKITDGVKANLNRPNSNLLGTPVIEVWTNPESANAPYNEVVSRTTREEAHQRLIKAMKQEYLELSHRQMRVLLTGDWELATQADLIREGEMDTLLQQASKRGILQIDPELLVDIKATGLWYEIGIDLVYKKPPNIREVNRSMEALEQEIAFSSPFRDAIKTASIHKLGSLMAATDQLTFDLAGQGIPAPADYKPEDFEESWPRQFGEAVPTLDKLWTMTHSTLLAVASQDDPLLQHLFALESLPHLRR